MLRSILLLLLLTGAGQASAQAASAARADEVAAAMALPDGLRQALDARQADRALPMREQVQGLLDYMIADDGLALRYQEQPTLGIAESYAQRRVNCLSFTLLFVAMARASGMHARVQASDDALAMEVLGDTLHRTSHVNAGIEIDGRDYTVDVGWRSMLAGHTPRAISDAQAIALLHNNQAVERLLLGDIVAASAGIDLALALDPANATLWSNAGVVHSRAGRVDAAERAYLRALKLQRDHLGALTNLVALHHGEGDAAQAGRYAKRLQRAQARDPYSQFLIAQELAESGAYDDAVAHFRRAIRLLPDEPEFHRSLAEAYRKQGKAVAAERARDRAGRLETKRATRRGIRDADDPGSG